MAVMQIHTWWDLAAILTGSHFPGGEFTGSTHLKL